MDLKPEILIPNTDQYDFNERSDLAYFMGKLVRNWNVITIFITLVTWSILAYGVYFRMDYHINNETRHLSATESVLLTEIGTKDVINRLNIIERRLAIVEKLIELGYEDPDTINAVIAALEKADSLSSLEIDIQKTP